MAIVSFKHKGLKLFFERGVCKGIQPAHAKKLANILVILDTISAPEQVTLKSYRLHALTGDLKGCWSCVSMQIGVLPFVSLEQTLNWLIIKITIEF
nr:type II toxin-antitoxin system RelE/ParE family toxin [Bartonella taylorii]